jgi:hypothetical protein
LAALAFSLTGCEGPRGDPVSVKTIGLKAGVVTTVAIPKSSKPKLVVSADEDLDVGLVDATKPAVELDKVVSDWRLPKRYQGREFQWSYTGIEKAMTLMIRSAKDTAVTIKFWNGNKASHVKLPE